MINSSILELRAALSKRHVGLVEFIGVNLHENYDLDCIVVRHSVVVQDFMMFCGFTGSMTTNWHKLLVSAVGETYEEHIQSIVNAAKKWRTEYQCVSIKESRKGVQQSLHGTSKIMPLEIALHLGKSVGTAESRLRITKMCSPEVLSS